MGSDPDGRRLDVARAQHDGQCAASWLGDLSWHSSPRSLVAPLAVIALLVVAVALVHLAITNLAACMAL